FLGTHADCSEVRLAGGLVVRARRRELAAGTACLLSLRPERLVLGGAASTASLQGHVVEVVYAGDTIRYWVEVQGVPGLLAKQANDGLATPLRPGDAVTVRWRSDDCKVFEGTE